MAYTATKTPQGNYEIFENGQRISTGSKSVLVNYGLSETQLSSPPPTPIPAPVQYNPPAISSPPSYTPSAPPTPPATPTITPVSTPVSPPPPPTPTPPAPTPITSTPLLSGYIGPSIVDYLNSIGQPSNLTSRATRATQMGFVSSPEEYLNLAKTGQNADINTKMLSAFRANQQRPQESGFQTPEQREKTFKGAGLTPEQEAGVVAGTGYDPLKVLEKHGVPLPDSNINPITAFTNTYKELLKSLGFTDIKSKYDEITKKYAEIKSELADKIAEVNENPWISEGSRSKKIALLQNKYDQKTSDLTKQLTLYENLYDDTRQEAQYIASKALEITHQQAVLDQKTKENALNRAEKLAEAEMKLQEKGTTKEGTTKKGTTKSGGLIYSAQDASEDSKALEQSRGTDGYVDPAIYLKLYQAWVGAGGLLKDFLTKFPPKSYVNPANKSLPLFLMPPKSSAVDFDNL